MSAPKNVHINALIKGRQDLRSKFLQHFASLATSLDGVVTRVGENNSTETHAERQYQFSTTQVGDIFLCGAKEFCRSQEPREVGVRPEVVVQFWTPGVM